jgi:hypothetical protein
MAPKFSGGTAARGVVAYQDHLNPEQFHYVPAKVDVILGETLPEVNVKYWGIGKQYLIQNDKGHIKSVTGAILSGRAVLDISEYQRSAIRAEITRAYRVPDPKLLPINLRNVQVQPVIGEKTLQLGEGADIQFPQTVQMGSTFNYLVGTGNSLFAAFVGAQSIGTEPTPNPSFGINIFGDAEFQGDPWIVKVTADLSQVWSYVRRQFNVGLSFGWFQIPLAKYEQIIMDMHREEIIKLDFIEGSLDNEKFGRQIFEMGKEILEAVNALVDTQQGFFKFEPNPEPSSADQPTSPLSWAWRMFLNVGFGEESIQSSQSTHLEKQITYSGRLSVRVPSSMTLAVSCNDATGDYFQDLGAPDQPCITQNKVKELQDRLKHEYEAKSNLEKQLYEKFVLGDISEDEYYAAMNRLHGFSSSEDGYLLTDISKELADQLPFSGFPVILGLGDKDIESLLYTRPMTTV